MIVDLRATINFGERNIVGLAYINIVFPAPAVNVSQFRNCTHARRRLTNAVKPEFRIFFQFPLLKLNAIRKPDTSPWLPQSDSRFLAPTWIDAGCRA